MKYNLANPQPICYMCLFGSFFHFVFSNQTLIDFREFYGNDDDLKPGKKVYLFRFICVIIEHLLKIVFYLLYIWF